MDKKKREFEKLLLAHNDAATRLRCARDMHHHEILFLVQTKQQDGARLSQLINERNREVEFAQNAVNDLKSRIKSSDYYNNTLDRKQRLRILMEM